MVHSKKIIGLLKATLTAGALLTSSTAQVSVENTSENKKIPQYQIDFENLSLVKRKDFVNHLVEAKRLFSQKRVFETFDVLAKAKLILPDFPQLNNMFGAAYVELRDFDEAFNYFQKAYDAEPADLGVLFNIGEIFFVQAKWQQSKSYFSKVIIRSEANPSVTSKLAELKVAVCNLKLGFTEKAEKALEKYSYREDTPVYYYLSAVIAFEKGDKQKANEYLGIARKVFSKQGLEPWQDCLVEANYLSSFYRPADGAPEVNEAAITQ